ncbi:hypothetical protein [Mastigocoleus testarum]|uniref:hypothetical protein n=1 Tax=Mastigocoleus testarum TaxID=996925 RepID=UPI0004292F33|nr:hypothetical protein [Mastigocoleus testarum]
MIEQIQTEINAIRTQIDVLDKERSNLSVELDIIDASPEGIVNAYRRRASENIENAAQIKGIDDALAALKVILEEKQSQLKHLISLEPQTSSIEQIEDQIEITKKQAKVHAERVNSLAEELKQEVRLLKSCADKISPLYWRIYYKPFITGFKSISVPHVRSDREVWKIFNHTV